MIAPTILRRCSWLFAAAAIAMVAVAVWVPTSHSRLLPFGLALLVASFLTALWRHFFLRSPIPSRWGGTLTYREKPLSYLGWFICASAFGLFMIAVLVSNATQSSAP